MYDHAVFAILTACDYKNKASSAFRLPENVRWLRKAVGGVAEQPTIDSREATPAEDSYPEDEEASAVDRLVVTFDELLETLHNGLQLGTHPSSSHILLGHRGTPGISAKQCNITVDDDLCIWLHDYHSAHGTAVGYEAHPQYVENLQAFVKKCREAAEKSKDGVPAVDRLGLDSETQPPSEAQTIDEKLIYYHDEGIGKGAFGEVRRVIRARDGKVLAAKTFKPPANKRKLDDVDPTWLTRIRREFIIMKENPHSNVMQVYDFREVPEPMIIMTYYPDGNVVDAGVVDDERYVSALGQILDGLSHLHAKGVAHRDLKPENFLVEKKPFFKVVITDFGLSKVVTNTTLLTTFCGTLRYLAPEVFPGLSDGHGPLVDVWSLGVIVYEWIYGIPRPPESPKPKKNRTIIMPEQWYDWVEAWSTKLLSKLDDEDGGQMVEILLRMIEVKIKKRWPAKKCLARGFDNGLFKRREVDGLVVCISDPDDHVLPTEEEDDGLKTPPAASPSVGAPLPQSLAGIDPEATVILGNMWG